jgi:signal transduction histidine kinase
MTVNKQILNLSKLTEVHALTFEAVALDCESKLVYGIEDGIEIRSDEEKISQIITILLDNAIKYSTKGTEIHLSLKREDRKVIFLITNQFQGGIKNPDQLFERFYREDEARIHNNGGYGLGLSIAKSLSREINGKLDVAVNQQMISFSLTL